jgi:hypothetical protein
MPQTLPALCIIATPTRRRLAVAAAQEAERRGFAGLYIPSPFGNMSFCEALAWNTSTIPFATAIAPIYQRTVEDFAQSAAFMHEVSGAASTSASASPTGPATSAWGSRRAGRWPISAPSSTDIVATTVSARCRR